MIADEVEKKLLEASEEGYRDFSSKLSPAVKDILGVRVPQVKKIAAWVLENDYMSYLENDEFKYNEERMIQGIIIAKSKDSICQKIKWLKEFIPNIRDWSVCDVCASAFRLKKDDMDDMFEFLSSYRDSDKEYELRFMTVMMMNHYMDEKYIDRIVDIIDSIHVDYYYTNMAIAWLISSMYIKYKDKAIRYLNDNKLDKFTYNKSLQKIIESRKVTPEEKDMIRRMKRK